MTLEEILSKECREKGLTSIANFIDQEEMVDLMSDCGWNMSSMQC